MEPNRHCVRLLGTFPLQARSPARTANDHGTLFSFPSDRRGRVAGDHLRHHSCSPGSVDRGGWDLASDFRRSGYYSLAGLGLLASGWPSLRFDAGHMAFLLTYIFSWLWTVWEVGWSTWPLVPRVVAPTVLLIAALLCVPVLQRRSPPGADWRWYGRATFGSVLVLLPS
jgi:hypothetical protein